MQAHHRTFLAKYVVTAVLALGSSSAFAQVSLSVDVAPPPLPVYAQPECPGDGYIWTPGYWAYDNDAYYWVPGAWIQPPEVGLFWTPSYWGWGGNAFLFHSGYWGSNVGYYGGINYGYGYSGRGYGGGRWEGRQFYYNQSVNNLRSANFRHVYNDRSAISSSGRNVSYNGGNGGVAAQPTARERQFSSERHIGATSAQQARSQAASQHRTPAAVNNARAEAPAAAGANSYRSASPQPATEQRAADRWTVPAPADSAAKRNAGAYPDGQIKAKAQVPSESQNERRPQSPEPAGTPRAEAPEKRAQPAAKAESRPQAQPARGPSGAEAHAQPGSEKSQAH
jgi:hypothetical protein